MLRVGVDVWLYDNLGARAASPLHGGVEIIYLEPQYDTVSGCCRPGVDEVGMVLLVPRMQLQQQPARARDPIVHVAMAVFGKGVSPKQFGVPATARPNIAHRDERLRFDGGFQRRAPASKSDVWPCVLPRGGASSSPVRTGCTASAT